MEFNIELAAYSDIGKIREKNEDSVLIAPELCLGAVADGMGGHNSGEIASNIAVSILRQTLSDLKDKKITIPSNFERNLPHICRKVLYAAWIANKKIFNLARENPKRRGMGTTLSALYFENGLKCAAVHIGDSRIYLYRNGALSQISKDHSYVMEQVQKGLITKEEAGKSRIQNILTKALGLKSEILCDAILVKAQLGDIYVLCSDGVNKGLSDKEIEQIVQKNLSAGKLAHEIVKVSAGKDGKDNVSCVVCKIMPAKDKSFLETLFNSFKTKK